MLNGPPPFHKTDQVYKVAIDQVAKHDSNAWADKMVIAVEIESTGSFL